MPVPPGAEGKRAPMNPDIARKIQEIKNHKLFQEFWDETLKLLDESEYYEFGDAGCDPEADIEFWNEFLQQRAAKHRERADR